MSSPRILAYLALLAVSGCAEIAGKPSVAELGLDGAACLGKVPETIAGLAETHNNGLLAKAQQQSGKGGVCAAKSFAVTAPVAVFRVYDSGRPGSAYGGWWALARPSGGKDDYRAKNAICPDWSALDRLISCRIKTGAEIVLGTTQSVSCPDGKNYGKTPEIQVYVPNDQRNGVLYVEDCREEGAWP